MSAKFYKYQAEIVSWNHIRDKSSGTERSYLASGLICDGFINYLK